MNNRTSELDSLLGSLIRHGYEFVTVEKFVEMVRAKKPLPNKTCIMRIDVDSDPGYCVQIAEILKKNSCDATFYFRLNTMHRKIMRQLLKDGFEVGYHFEEIASLAKKDHLKSTDEVMARIDDCRALFRKNFAYFTSELGKAPTTVASHGDFANRKLRMTNSIIVDHALRQELGIEAETYDADIVDAIDVNVIDDRTAADWWSPEPPEQLASKALEGPHCMRILVHPRNWRPHLYWNTRENVERVVQGLRY